MKKIIVLLLLLSSAILTYGQDLMYEFQNGKQYCTIEIDTLSTGFEGSLKALDCYKVPYYELVFQPTITYNNTGDLILTIVPRWHYYSFLEKVYGEIEKAQVDPNFKMTFKINNEDNTLEYISTEEEKDYVTNKSSFSLFKTMNFTKLPRSFSRINQSSIDYKKYPKDLQRKLQARNEMLKSRFDKKIESNTSLFEPVKPYVSTKVETEVIENNEFE